jgi:UDP-glucose-4-epimerase GalE
MRILVTGGAGYIGSHAIRRLQAAGHEAVVFDNLSTGHREVVQGYDLIVGDISDQETLQGALRGVDSVMHFAANSCVAESVRDPRKYFRNNVSSALTLLNEALDAGIRRFIMSSTCAVYGLPRAVPIPDGSPRIPVSPYGATKLAMENVLESYSKAYDFRFVALRYFNAAGADESAEIGELHRPETHLIPSALEAAAGIRDGIDVYGTDYPTPDGTCIRDYVHVNDLAEAHVRALEYLAAGGESTAFNLGTGNGNSVLEVLAVVKEVTRKEPPKRFRPRRPGDPPILVADAAKAREQLDWMPLRSLREIVTTAWEWMQSPAWASINNLAAVPREKS